MSDLTSLWRTTLLRRLALAPVALLVVSLSFLLYKIGDHYERGPQLCGIHNVDVGTITPGDFPHMRFNITNCGSAQVAVASLDRDCSCLSVLPIEGRLLDAGKSLEIHASLNPRSIRGNFAKTITVSLVPPTMKPLVLRATGRVESRFASSSRLLSTHDNTQEVEITISAVGGVPFRIHGCEEDDFYVGSVQHFPTEPGISHSFTVSMRSQPRNRQLLVYVDDSREPYVFVDCNLQSMMSSHSFTSERRRL